MTCVRQRIYRHQCNTWQRDSSGGHFPFIILYCILSVLGLRNIDVAKLASLSASGPFFKRKKERKERKKEKRKKERKKERKKKKKRKKKIHEGNCIGSRNQKRDYWLHWPGVIVTELGHGRSRNRFRSLFILNCGPSSRWIFINHSSLCPLAGILWKGNFVIIPGIGKTKWYTAVLVRLWYYVISPAPFWLILSHFVDCNVDLQSSLAFDLVTCRYPAR